VCVCKVNFLNLSPLITRLGGQVPKKVLYKSCWTRRGTYDYDLELDLNHVL